MAWILGYGCVTSAGETSEHFWRALVAGQNTSTALMNARLPDYWPQELQGHELDGGRAFLIEDRENNANMTAFKTARQTLAHRLFQAWSELCRHISTSEVKRIRGAPKFGLILATTKSFVDDYIWDPEGEKKQILNQDCFAPILRDFVAASGLRPKAMAIVSNACASSHSACSLAQSWLSSDRVTEVLVISADVVGAFVYRGFQGLKVITADAVRPFSKDRSGFFLGEAAAAVLFSKQLSRTGLRLGGVGIDAEGFAVTRSSQTGESLKRACLQIPELLRLPPDLIIAHGTATIVNDRTEDLVYGSLFGQRRIGPVITGTKWCVGHTLGTSGLLDVIAACKVLETQKAFSLNTTVEVDPEFRCTYLHRGADFAVRPLSKVLLCSLGFGGIHAAATVERTEGFG